MWVLEDIVGLEKKFIERGKSIFEVYYCWADWFDVYAEFVWEYSEGLRTINVPYKENIASIVEKIEDLMIFQESFIRLISAYQD